MYGDSDADDERPYTSRSPAVAMAGDQALPAAGEREAESTVLEIRDLSVRYGAITAVRDVALSVRKGEIVALLGPNGAGKSTIARAVTGLLAHHGGSIAAGKVLVDGREVQRRSAPQIVRAGVSQVLEGRQTIAELSVAENLKVGGYAQRGRSRARTREVLEEVLDLFPVLRQRFHDQAGYLSGGEQQMLVIGRALMQEPSVLILDEPSLGLSPKMSATIYELIRRINAESRTSLLLIEQNATAAFEVADHAYVLEHGRVALHGTAAQLAQDEHVHEAYLGMGDTEQSYRSALGADTQMRAAKTEHADRLVVQDLTLTIGGVKPLDDVSFSVKQGEFFAVIGPNGAGKTSLLNSLSGFYRPQQGSIVFDGTPVLGLSPSTIARRGCARTFQNLALFDELPVIDNVMVGRERFRRSNALDGAVWIGRARREEVAAREICHDIIDRMGLSRLRNQPVGALAYGQRKRVELARALASEPRLLLLDEPVAGMNFEESAELMSYVLRTQKDLDLSVLLVEHDMQLVMEVAERILVLDFGHPIALDVPEVVRANPAVVAAYLGAAHDRAEEKAEASA
jgi:branched-chain amino acid transport system ATP-binding protein